MWLSRLVLVYNLFWSGKVSESVLFNSSTLQKSPPQITRDCAFVYGCHENIEVDLDHSLFEVSNRFLSVTIDSNAMRNHWGALDLTQPHLLTLARGLSPATLRVGGTLQNYAIFSHHDKVTRTEKFSEYPYRNFIVSRSDWDVLNEFVQKAGWDLVFGLNDNLIKNRTTGEWNCSNAKELMQYTKSKNYQVTAWALGNEPDAKDPKVQTNNYNILDDLLSKMGWPKQSIVGPHTAALTEYYSEFLKYVKPGILKASTYHHYYLNGRLAKEKDFILASRLDSFGATADRARKISLKYQPKSEIWLGETASTYNGGTAGLSDAYIAGFMWLDKLGLAAVRKHSKVLRQTFYGGFYSLLNPDGYPQPDYWLSYLYKNLVGTTVLSVSGSTRRLRKVRIYAHCINPRNTLYEPGDVVLLAMNLNKCPTLVTLKNEQFTYGPKHMYWLQPDGNDGLRSKNVTLNGKLLEMMDDFTLPEIQPIQKSSSSTFLLPAMTYGFVVIQNVKANACVPMSKKQI